MNSYQNCSDTSDAVELFPPQGLFLKPIARLNVSVQLPQMKLPGKTISNWEVMEKLRSMIKPEEFTSLKVSKSTLEFIRFEGEIENKSKLSYVIGRIDGRTMKLVGFSELLKIRSAEAKISFPTRHTWDSYFRDAKNMNEMKPGERPDTIHLSNLPCKWFAAKQDITKGNDKPSEYIFRKVFEVFGDVRCVDIPAADPYRNRMKAHISGIKMFSFGQDLSFEGYVQFKEYICFVKAMDALRGMKLLYKDGDGAYTASIKVDFDKTKHLSEPSIRRRRTEREKLMAVDREREERERQEQEAEEERLEKERQQKLEEKRLKAERQRQREERRKEKFLMEMKEKETQEMNIKIALEERKLLIAQRKLESIRLLDDLFERLKNAVAERNTEEASGHEKPVRDVVDKQRKARLKSSKRQLAHRYKSLHQHRERLRRAVEGEASGHHSSSEQLSSTPASSSFDTCSSSSHSSSSSHKPTPDKGGLSNDNIQYNNYWYSNEKPYYNEIGYPFPENMNHYSSQGYNQYEYSNPHFHHYRGGPRYYPRRRGFFTPHWQRYQRAGRDKFHNYHPHSHGGPNSNFYQEVNDEYYRYFQRLAKQDAVENEDSCSSYSSKYSGAESRSGSFRSSSGNKSKSKFKNSDSKSRSQRSKSKTRSYRSRSGSHSKSKSQRSRSRTKSHGSKSQRSRSRSRRSRSKTGSHRSRSKTKSYSTKSRRSKSRSNRWNSRSRSPDHRSWKSRSPSLSRSFSTSWSFSRSRSRSWTQHSMDNFNEDMEAESGGSHRKKHKKHKSKNSVKKKIGK